MYPWVKRSVTRGMRLCAFQCCPEGAVELLLPPQFLSIKYIFLLILDLVRSQQLQQLRLEVLILMMLGLTFDVRLNRGLLRFADGEDRVALLPREVGHR